MNITLTAPKKNVKIIGNKAKVSVPMKSIEKAFREAEEQAWEKEILKRAKSIDPKNPSKNTISAEKFFKEMGIE